MRDAGKPYSTIRLHVRDANGWGVIDARGALVDRQGLCMGLTKEEADATAVRWNEEAERLERSNAVTETAN